MSMTFTYFGLFLSLITVIDLYMVLRNPFANSDKRVKKLILIAMMLALVLGTISLYLTSSKTALVAQFNYYMLVLVFWPVIIVALFIMLLIVWRLRKKGMNKRIKKSIRKRYLEFVLLLSLCSWWMQLVMKPSYRYE